MDDALRVHLAFLWDPVRFFSRIVWIIDNSYIPCYIFLGPSDSDPSGLGRLEEANRSLERFCVLSDSVACVDLVNGLTTRRSAACISQGKPLLELVHLNFF